MKSVKKTASEYARVLNKRNPNWDESGGQRYCFLRTREIYASEVLKKQGYLFLNDVYKLLGLSARQVGQVVGWRYDTENSLGDNYVEFEIVEERDDYILLDFNVDGEILNFLPD